MIVCIAVVGHQNNPLYLQSFTEADDALKLHHIVHCSLDVIDERVVQKQRKHLFFSLMANPFIQKICEIPANRFSIPKMPNLRKHLQIIYFSFRCRRWKLL